MLIKGFIDSVGQIDLGEVENVNCGVLIDTFGRKVAIVGLSKEEMRGMALIWAGASNNVQITLQAEDDSVAEA